MTRSDNLAIGMIGYALFVGAFWVLLWVTGSWIFGGQLPSLTWWQFGILIPVTGGVWTGLELGSGLIYEKFGGGDRRVPRWKRFFGALLSAVVVIAGVVLLGQVWKSAV